MELMLCLYRMSSPAHYLTLLLSAFAILHSSGSVNETDSNETEVYLLALRQSDNHSDLAGNASEGFNTTFVFEKSLLRGYAKNGHCTGSYFYNCNWNPNCCDPSARCYEKIPGLALCLRSCEPGIHWQDPPKWRQPWSCKRVDEAGGPPAPRPSPPPPSEPSKCVKSHKEDCHGNPNCCDSEMTCFEKNSKWAACIPDCKPGIHKDDPWKWRTPWSCKRLTPSTTSPAPTDPTKPSKPGGNPLEKPSNADVLKFFTYRAFSPSNYPPSNTNTADLSGVMWYIQNEVVSGVYGPGNKYGIIRIRRYEVQTKATQPLIDKGMNFGVRVAFDNANCTGPRCDFSWDTYGYNVGCNNLGDYPFPKYDTHYPRGIWYSLPGSCPSQPFWAKTKECKQQEPGGLCEGVPTGEGSCTWSYKDAGQIYLEELYEGTTRKDFWADAEDDEKNARRVEVARALFEKKYGPDTPTPPCDFDFDKFFGR